MMLAACKACSRRSNMIVFQASLSGGEWEAKPPGPTARVHELQIDAVNISCLILHTKTVKIYCKVVGSSVAYTASSPSSDIICIREAKTVPDSEDAKRDG